jgi:hypothetical protein
MNSTARPEIKKFADEAFAIARDRILVECANERTHVLGGVRLRGNSGGYVPALIGLAAQHVRRMILARADADAESFALHATPSDALAEAALQMTAKQIAGGAISAVRGELHLRAMRTRKHEGDPGGHLDQEVAAAMNSALQEGLLALRRQRISAKHPLGLRAAPTAAEPRPNPSTTATGGSPTSTTEVEKKALLIELMQLIEEWRITADSGGAKFTQKQVAEMMKLDLRAYQAAKRGSPRGKDHLGRARNFAIAKGIVPQG